MARELRGRQHPLTTHGSIQRDNATTAMTTGIAAATAVAVAVTVMVTVTVTVTTVGVVAVAVGEGEAVVEWQAGNRSGEPLWTGYFCCSSGA